MILSELTYVAIIPLAVAAMTALASRSLRFPPAIAWATCVTAGYIAGQLALASRAGHALASILHPREAADWLPHALLLALGITILATLARHPWHRLGYALALMLSIGLPLRLLSGSAYDLNWSLLEKTAHIALLAATLCLTWLTLASAADSGHPLLRPVLLIVTACGAAVVVTFSGVFVYGELCGVVAAALTGMLLASRTPHVAGAAGAVTFSLGGLILLSYFYAELTAANAALVFLAIMLSGGPMPASLSSQTAWLRAALRVVLALIPMAIAIAQTLAATQAPASTSPYWQ